MLWRSSLLVGMLALILVWTGSAEAATTLGQNAPGTANVCSGEGFYLEVSPAYSVPAGGGVITSWSTNGLANGSGGQATFKVFRSVGGTSFLVTGTDVTRNLPTSGLSTFPVRIPVTGEETLGIHTPSASIRCYFSGSGTMRYGGDASNPPVGSTVNANYSAAVRLNVSAVLEPDGDRDGYGDETQDRCPADASTQGPCGGSGPGGGGGNGSPSLLSRVGAKPKAFRSGSGTTFRYTLSETAGVTIAIQRVRRGHRVGRKCKARGRGRRCKRYKRIGVLKDSGTVGNNTKAFSGRIRGHRLRPGSYRAVLKAVSASGVRSTAKFVSFRVLPRRRR
jgi:hypothetical protein